MACLLGQCRRFRRGPNIDWVLPAGVTVGKMQFPTPKRLPLGPLMDYGYEGTAVFPFEMKPDGTSRVSNSSFNPVLRSQYVNQSFPFLPFLDRLPLSRF